MNVRRKRARMLIELLGGPEIVMTSGNLSMVLHETLRVAVYFRDTLIGWVHYDGQRRDMMVVINAANEHATTAATRYQIKQLQEAVDEIEAVRALTP